MKRNLLRTIIIMFVVAGFAGLAFAEFPEKPIKVIVPYATGGGSDVTCRIIQKVWSKYSPQPLVVVNKPGAAGMLGAREVRNAAADGYTLLSYHLVLLIQEALGKLDFTYENFDLVAATSKDTNLLVVPKNSPYKTMADFVKNAKANPNTVTQATNLTSWVHFVYLQLQEATGINLRLVQVGGSGARIPNIVGGHSDSSLQLPGEVVQYHKSGDLHALCIFDYNRHSMFPNVPSTKELGYDLAPLFISFWWLGPKGIPKDRLDILSNTLEKAYNDPEAKVAFENRGRTYLYLKGPAFQAQVKKERKTIFELAKKFGIGKKK